MTQVAVLLTAALFGWKADIEAKGKAPLLVAKVVYSAETNTMTLPAGTERQELFANYLQQEEFMKQFQHMYAVMVHHKGVEGEAYLVMLNGAREKEWAGNEEAMLAHEFGHAWLKAQGYPGPMLINNKWACVGIHTGDITQHVLIRREMERRGIDYKTFWLKSLDEASRLMEASPAPPVKDRCARVRQAAQLVDVRLGLKEGEWAGRQRYEAAVKKAMPEVESTVEEIVKYLEQHDMANKAEHREALVVVFGKLRDLGYQRTKDYIVENKSLSCCSVAR